nr:unnamed protein product [Callosobruchus analis]
MPQVDVLFNELQKRKINPVEINQKIQSFEQNIMTIRNSIDEIINEATDRRRNNDSHFDHRIAALEVCDTIINCAKDQICSGCYFQYTLIRCQACNSRWCITIRKQEIN